MASDRALARRAVRLTTECQAFRGTLAARCSSAGRPPGRPRASLNGPLGFVFARAGVCLAGRFQRPTGLAGSEHPHPPGAGVVRPRSHRRGSGRDAELAAGGAGRRWCYSLQRPGILCALRCQRLLSAQVADRASGAGARRPGAVHVLRRWLVADLWRTGRSIRRSPIPHISGGGEGVYAAGTSVPAS